MHDFQQLRCNPIECVPPLFSLVHHVAENSVVNHCFSYNVVRLHLMYSKLELVTVTVYAVVAFKSVKNRLCKKNIF